MKKLAKSLYAVEEALPGFSGDDDARFVGVEKIPLVGEIALGLESLTREEGAHAGLGEARKHDDAFAKEEAAAGIDRNLLAGLLLDFGAQGVGTVAIFGGVLGVDENAAVGGEIKCAFPDANLFRNRQQLQRDRRRSCLRKNWNTKKSR